MIYLDLITTLVKLIEQSSNELSLPEAIELLKVNPNIEYKSTIADNFKDIYFTDEENKQIDVLFKMQIF